MTRSPKLIVAVVAACAEFGAIGAGVVYHFQTTNNSTTINNVAPNTAIPSVEQRTQAVPTPAYLATHLSVFRAAQVQCQENEPGNIALCDNVRKAGALMLADQYGNAAESRTH